MSSNKPLLRISRWQEHYENNRSRTVKDLRWVSMPNRHDGEYYTATVTGQHGAEVFSAWVLVIQVASRCQPRGTLVRSNGSPHDAASLSLKTRAPKKWFEKAIPWLLENTDWLEVVEDASGHQGTDRQLTLTCQAGDEEGKGMEVKGTEGKTPKGDDAVIIPESLNTPTFREAWNEWKDYRRTVKKIKDPARMWRKTLKELEAIGPERAIAAINHSIANEYQGLYEPKNNENSNRNSRTNPRNAGIPTDTDDLGKRIAAHVASQQRPRG